MLRRTAFKNFLCFKDHQSLTFNHGPNFIVGQNATGKSAIFELIRRCLSQSASSSDSSVTDKSKGAFVISEFEIKKGLSNKVPVGSRLYSLYAKRLINGEVETYKLVYISQNDKAQDKCYLDFLDASETSLKGNVEDILVELKSLFVKDHGTDPLLTALEEINSMVPEKDERDSRTPDEKTDCEIILKALNGVVAITFPIRSPGQIQWNHSENIGIGTEHYDKASEKAEILQELLESPDVDEEILDKIFQKITNPLKYKFKKSQPPLLTITVVDDDTNEDIRFLKVPEGIIEAMQFALMLANKKYQTLMLEEPDRGMHPQMIQKLRDSIREYVHEDQKTLTLTSHQPVMINRWAMSRLYVCGRKRVASRNFKHWICNWGKDVTHTHQHLDQLKQMLYSEAVLFVEGITDKSVIGWIFDRVLDPDFKYLTDFSEEELAELKKIIGGTQIISMEGANGYQELTQVAVKMEVPFVFLLDADIVFKYPKNVQQRTEINAVYDTFTKEASKNVDVASIMVLLSTCKLDTDKAKKFDLPPDCKDFKATKDHLKEKKNIFIWDSRNLEVMILKSIVDIRDQLIDKKMIGYLKTKSKLLKMEMETAGTLAECLLKGQEMIEFFKFLLKTRMQP